MCHDDETGNTHCHAFIQPIDQKGHLNASFLQTEKKMEDPDIHDCRTLMQKLYGSLGLQRGMKGSKARHKDIKNFIRN